MSSLHDDQDRVNAQSVYDKSRSRSLKHILTALAVCAAVFGVIGIALVVSEADYRAQERVRKDKYIESQYQEQKDATAKAQAEKTCTNPTIYGDGHIQETPTLAIRVVSAFDTTKEVVTPATDTTLQSTPKERRIRVVWTITNKTSAPVALNRSGLSYSIPVFLIGDKILDSQEASAEIDSDNILGERGLVSSLDPNEVATVAYTVKPAPSIVIGLGSVVSPSSCFMGWRVR